LVPVSDRIVQSGTNLPQAKLTSPLVKFYPNSNTSPNIILTSITNNVIYLFWRFRIYLSRDDLLVSKKYFGGIML
jgi:hypothetical protein